MLKMAIFPLLLALQVVRGFHITGSPVLHGRSAISWRSGRPHSGLFDGLAKAFENDSSLGERKNAGLTKEAEKRTITWLGPKGEKKTVRSVSPETEAFKEVADALERICEDIHQLHPLAPYTPFTREYYDESLLRCTDDIPTCY